MTDEESDDWLSEFELQRKREREEAKKTFADACTELSTLGVAQVKIEYCGYGDEGTIQDVQATNDRGECPLPDDLANALVIAAEQILPDGWEDGEGLFGAILLDVAARRLTLECSERVEITETDEEAWDL